MDKKVDLLNFANGYPVTIHLFFDKNRVVTGTVFSGIHALIGGFNIYCEKTTFLE